VTRAAPRVLILTVGMGTGGAEALIRDSLPLLREEGFDCSVWVLKQKSPDLEAIRLAGHPVRALADNGTARVAPWMRLMRSIRAERFDLIHSHLFWANLAARAAGRWGAVPVVINSHHGTDGWLSLSHRLLEKSTVACTDKVVACSEAVRRFAVERLRLPAAKVLAIPNGIPVERFADRSGREAARAELGLDANTFAVGSVGRLDEPVKGYAVLLAALQRVCAAHSEVVCLLCGDGPARARLEAMAGERGLASRVRFLGERQDVPRILQALDLYVQPSLMEGFGLSVLEAMASRLPVIATTSGGLPEVARAGVTADLVPPGSAARLAFGIEALIGDPARRAAYAREGEARARSEFRLERMVRAWSDLYRGLLASKRRAAA
jgi:glycosyltransferase involved in cell wall biosynthesis